MKKLTVSTIKFEIELFTDVLYNFFCHHLFIRSPQQPHIRPLVYNNPSTLRQAGVRGKEAHESLNS
jgi:hypothetical protein